MRQTKTLRRLAALLCTLALALALAPAAGAEGAAPVAGANAGKHIYETHYATQEESFLFPNSQGGFTRVERVYENFARPIVVEEYNASFQLVTSRTFALELLLWGGFYSGSQYNFLMFSQSNDAEDDSREVLRVVKYSKDWERLGSVSICGENTFRLMRSGSLRCAEQDGILYIYSCHTMYKAQDGKNHQASVMFSVRESDMTYEVQKYFYVSHSFDQYILIDQQKRIVTADLATAIPAAPSTSSGFPRTATPCSGPTSMSRLPSTASRAKRATTPPASAWAALRKPRTALSPPSPSGPRRRPPAPERKTSSLATRIRPAWSPVKSSSTPSRAQPRPRWCPPA